MAERKAPNNKTMSNTKLKDAINAHQTAMEDVVSVNGIFSFAMFLGLTFSEEVSLQSKPECKLKDINSVARRLFVFDVISFSCFLLSSLTAKALKSRLSTYSLNVSDLMAFNRIFNKFIRGVLLFITVSATTSGCIFLTMSMVDVVRMRLGKITCESEALQAAASLIAIVSLALVIYFPASMYEVYASMKNVEQVVASETS